MAGIAFTLRELVRRDDLYSVTRGYLLAGLISTGPWLFTITALLMVEIAASGSAGAEAVTQFRGVIVYNFAFSLVLSGPIVWVTTRYVADCVYNNKLAPVPGTLFISLGTVTLSSLMIAGPYYYFGTDLPAMVKVAAVMNYMLVAATWVVGVFLSVLRGYLLYAVTFCLGIMGAAGIASLLNPIFGVIGLLSGFNLGLSVVVFSLLGRVLIAFPYDFRRPVGFANYFRRYWDLALFGFIAALALWIDKWVMWFAPEASLTESGMRFFYDYDNAMFLVYLSVIPGLTYLFLSVETGLDERVRGYLRAANGEATRAELEVERKEVSKFVIERLRTIIVVQGTVSVLIAFYAPEILVYLGASYSQTGMFRLGVLAAFFHVQVIFVVAILTYLDIRRINLKLQIVFVALSASGTLLTLQSGYSTYGLGYLAAAMIVWVLAYAYLLRVLRDLLFYTYVVVNATNLNDSLTVSQEPFIGAASNGSEGVP